MRGQRAYPKGESLATNTGALGFNVLRPMLIGLVPWADSRFGFGFRSGHLSKRERSWAQQKALPHG